MSYPTPDGTDVLTGPRTFLDISRNKRTFADISALRRSALKQNAIKNIPDRHPRKAEYGGIPWVPKRRRT